MDTFATIWKGNIVKHTTTAATENLRTQDRHRQGWAKAGQAHPIVSIAHPKFK